MSIILLDGAKSEKALPTVIVYLESRDKVNWSPIERDGIPEWLLDERLTDKMLAGACLRNVLEEAEKKRLMFYTAVYAHQLRIHPKNIVVPNLIIARNDPIQRPH